MKYIPVKRKDILVKKERYTSKKGNMYTSEKGKIYW